MSHACSTCTISTSSCDSLCVSLFCVRFTPNERTRKAVQLGARIFAPHTARSLSLRCAVCAKEKGGYGPQLHLRERPTLPRGRGRRPSAPRGNWLGSSLSSEPRGLTGLSVASHAGVLTRSKISGSLLHRLSRPWHAIYGARAQIFFACAAGDRSSSCSAIAASASSSSDSRCCFLSALRRHLAK